MFWIELIFWVITNAPSLIKAIIEIIKLIRRGGTSAEIRKAALHDLTEGLRSAKETGSADLLKAAVEKYSKRTNV